MDLRDEATRAAEAKRAADADARQAKADLDRINARAHLRRLFHDLLGITVLDGDLVETSDHGYTPGVVVDGLRMVAVAGTTRYDPKPCLHFAFVDDDGTFHHLDTSLTVSDVRTMHELGRVLDSGRRHGIYQAGVVAVGDYQGTVGYMPGVGLVARTGSTTASAEPIGGNTPLSPEPR